MEKKTLEEALPPGVVRPLSTVEQETGLARSSILTKGVSYRAANDSVVRGHVAHKGFVRIEPSASGEAPIVVTTESEAPAADPNPEPATETPADEAQHVD